MGVRPRLTPVGKLARLLVKLMLRVQRGLNRHHRLHVIKFSPCLRMTVGYGKVRFTRARRKQTLYRVPPWPQPQRG